MYQSSCLIHYTVESIEISLSVYWRCVPNHMPYSGGEVHREVCSPVSHHVIIHCSSPPSLSTSLSYLSTVAPPSLAWATPYIRNIWPLGQNWPAYYFNLSTTPSKEKLWKNAALCFSKQMVSLCVYKLESNRGCCLQLQLGYRPKIDSSSKEVPPGAVQFCMV